MTIITKLRAWFTMSRRLDRLPSRSTWFHRAAFLLTASWPHAVAIGACTLVGAVALTVLLGSVVGGWAFFAPLFTFLAAGCLVEWSFETRNCAVPEPLRGRLTALRADALAHGPDSARQVSEMWRDAYQLAIAESDLLARVQRTIRTNPAAFLSGRFGDQMDPKAFLGAPTLDLNGARHPQLLANYTEAHATYRAEQSQIRELITILDTRVKVLETYISGEKTLSDTQRAALHKAIPSNVKLPRVARALEDLAREQQLMEARTQYLLDVQASDYRDQDDGPSTLTPPLRRVG